MKTNILIDANPLIGNKTGVGHFTRRLVEALADNAPSDVQITAYYFNFLGRKDTSDLPVKSNLTYKEVKFIPTKAIAVLHKIGLQLPLEFIIGFRKRYDFIIFPNFVAIPSLRKTPYALAVYDMGFKDVPQYLPEGNRRYLDRFVERSVLNSSLIITISSFTKERIVKHYGQKIAPKIELLPIPYEKPILDALVSEKVKKLSQKPFVLYVGTIEPRKNLDGLLEGFALTSQVTRDQVQLIFVGGMGWKTEKTMEVIELTKDKIDLTLTGYLSDTDRDYLYRHAELICIPSHYEGFGMQIQEAMYYKKKLVLSSIPVFHEVAGNYANYFKLGDSKDLASTIETTLKQPVKTKVSAPNWSWEDNASKVLSWVTKLTSK